MTDHTTTKAVRATILLGDIPLNVYQLPNGRYKLAGRNITDAVGKHDSSLREIMGVKSLKALPGADKSLSEIVAESGEKFIPVATTDAVAYWTKLAIKGNAQACAMLGACAIEAIERRADAAFGVERDEETRNNWFATRVAGKKKRRDLTDAIKEYIARHNIPRYLERKLYAETTDLLNVLLFGATAQQLREVYGCPSNKLLRDEFDDDDLDDLKDRESHASQLITKYDIYPIDAINQAHQFWLDSL